MGILIHFNLRKSLMKSSTMVDLVVGIGDI